MRCLIHRKDTEVNCNWCGLRMCEDCVAGGNNKKVYCNKCVDKLGDL